MRTKIALQVGAFPKRQERKVAYGSLRSGT